MGTTYRELFKLYDLIQSVDTRSVELFLSENSVELNVILPCKGIGVLHLAVGIEDLEKSKGCTEIILKFGCDPNLSNDDGLTPVHIAAIWGRLDNLKLLIGCGGDPSRRDLDGYSAFDYAAREQQWDIYDYLHNVIDQIDDSNGSQCAYTLDLERILVTTDHMVAEYEPVDNNQLTSVSRKSDRIKEWCENNSLVMNKLYPTILGETYFIESDSSTRNTDVRSSNGTNYLNGSQSTFKTCMSRKASDIEISGIQPLEFTSDSSQSCSCIDLNNRASVYENFPLPANVYENFSLPGSPNCVTHKNYNTKTSLKTSKHKCNCIDAAIAGEMQSLTLDKSSSQSLLTDDNSQVLDKALIMVQNKTNEWLCSYSSDNDNRACNTRRSSASSGVSSHFSGSIVLANVSEEYKYEDKEESVVLIEKRLLVSSVVLPVDEIGDATVSDHTVLSVASSLPPSMEYDNNTLRAELINLGFKPGPIQDNTRTLYLKKLQALKKNPGVIKEQGKTYSIELAKSLRNEDWMVNLAPYIELENKVKMDFTNPNKNWREGTTKTSFTYLLLDPRLTDNLPAKAGRQNQHLSWVTFVNSIFYVGKGKRSRPYSHLYQALTLWKRNFTVSKDKKVQHILDIWSDKVGVICLHIFQNVIPAEAYTHEAAMIDVLGVQNLTNLKTGNYYGVASSWPMKERRMLGLYLLYKAMNIFLSEGERQLRPDDID